MGSVRLYEGVNLNAISDRDVRRALKVIDDFCRSAGQGIADAAAAATGVGSGGAPSSSPFVTIGNVAGLTAERALAVAAPITFSDGGANAAVTLGASLVVPAITYATAPAAGGANSLIRSDATILYPSTLLSPTSATTLALSDDAANQTLTGNLGSLTIRTSGSLIIASSAPASAGVGFVQMDLDAGARVGLSVQFQPITSAPTGIIVKCWEGKFPGIVGNTATTTWMTFGGSTTSITPGAGAGAGNKAYQLNMPSVSIANANGSWDEVFGAFIGGPARGSLANPTVTVAAGIKTECASISATDQYGIWIAQRSAQTTATNRYGLKIDAHNSGTNRWSAYLGDRVYAESPAARAITVLSLAQLATGAVAGAHVNLDDKAGDPPSPNAGDLWRNGTSLKYRKDGSTTVDLTAAVATGDNVTVNGAAVVDADFDDATPAAPVISGAIEYLNARWQKDASSPANISAYSGIDKNGNPILGYRATAAAVNYVFVANNATTAAPYIGAVGTDTNIDFGLVAQGTGAISLGISGAPNAARFFEMTAPATPAGNSVFLYAKDKSGTSNLYFKNDAGAEFDLSGSAGTSFADNVFDIHDDGDATKIAKFQASGIATGTTRTYTFPDTDATLAPVNGQLSLVSNLTKCIGLRTSVTVDLTYGNIRDTEILRRTGTTVAGVPRGMIGSTNMPDIATGVTASIADGQFLFQYLRLALLGTNRLDLAGTAEVVVTGFDRYGARYVGGPKSNLSFNVASDNMHTVPTRLALTLVNRATLEGNADLYLTDDFGTRQRIVLAG